MRDSLTTKGSLMIAGGILGETVPPEIGAVKIYRKQYDPTSFDFIEVKTRPCEASDFTADVSDMDDAVDFSAPGSGKGSFYETVKTKRELA